MSLTTRLSAFFLLALAVVLASFSAVLLVLASLYLDRQVETQAASSLDILTSAAEVGDDGSVEWEPNDRMMTLGRDAGPDGVRWTVTDDSDHVLDRSREQGILSTDWHQTRRHLGPDSRGLTLNVRVPLRQTRDARRLLILAVSTLSLTVWLLCAVLSRRFCRRALAPVLRMASEARGMTADDQGGRLTEPDQGDELGELGRSFNDLLTRRHEAFARQSRFTRDASHQLRTPLAAMLGQVEVALRRDRPVEEYQRVLRLVGHRTEHMKRIVELMLFLARADVDASRPDLEILELNNWFHDAMLRHASHPRVLDFKISQTATELMIRGSSLMLDELLDNLLDNAAKYSEPGTSIELRLGIDSAGRPFLRVSDFGVGITAQEIPFLFEPFHRGQESRRLGVPGVGLGLSVARRITESLGATIEVETQWRTGTCFSVIFPNVQMCELPTEAEVSVPT